MANLKYEHFTIKSARYVLDKANCPKCGALSKRKGTYTRQPIDVGIDSPVLLVVKVSYHICPNGCGSFSVRPPFLSKYRHYTDDAIEKSINSVIEDKVSINQAVCRMDRDFHIHPSKSTLWRWINQKAQKVDITGYENYVVESFSGVMCVDEVYDGKFGIIFATDPINDTLVGHLIGDSHITQEKLKEFLIELRNKGIDIKVLITDNSSLYVDELIKGVFPDAEHQLCQFHLLKSITQEALKSTKKLRDQIEQDIPRLPRGRPSSEKKNVADKVNQLKKDKKEIFQNRHLFIKKEKNLTSQEKEKRDTLCVKYPLLILIVCCMAKIYELFESEDYHTAIQRYENLINSPFATHPLTSNIVAKIKNRQTFEKAFTYLRVGIKERTNNHVERYNRGFRKIQKSCNNLRTESTIDNRLKLDKSKKLKKKYSCKEEILVCEG